MLLHWCQPDLNYCWDLIPGLHQLWRIIRRCWVHVCAVSCPIDKDGHQAVRDVSSNSKSMPWVNRSIGKHNIGDRFTDLFSSIHAISLFNVLCYSACIDIKQYLTYSSEHVQRDQAPKWLVFGIRCLKVSQFCAGLVEPLAGCMKTEIMRLAMPNGHTKGYILATKRDGSACIERFGGWIRKSQQWALLALT